ncbi:hypothetical protein [uncultured Flavobacterium sp.]|uniref:hypothetical protein n=1 Tax=uncultured Flavobacterium sp. TaxID=165435 RepID=UPI0025DDE7BA|nr:hypothetical protein [uncultured Flavobacterium sp.]
MIFFACGYMHGKVNFGTDNRSYYIDATPAIVIMLSIVLGLLVTVVWLVFYLRNNGYKSMYPLKSSALYKEWLIILLAFSLNCCYSLSFMFGYDVRAKSYFSEKEFSDRIDVISMASIFADGGFLDSGEYSVNVNGKYITKKRNYITFRDRQYPLHSLFNKSMLEFGYHDRIKDSLIELRAKTWLFNNHKDSVLWVMKEFDKIVKSHNAPTNLTPEKWLGMVYDPPQFASYLTVGKQERYEWYDMRVPFPEIPDTPISVNSEDYEGSNEVDLKSNTVKVIDSIVYIYPKHHIPLNQLEQAYSKISEGYTNPKANAGAALAYFYVALGFSVLLFSFRVTSGRSWLIAMVAFGITALVTGILNFIIMDIVLEGTVFRRFDGIVFLSLWIIIVMALLIAFFVKKRSKGKSGIILNILLWLLPAVLPVLLFISVEIARIIAERTSVYDAKLQRYTQTPYQDFMENNSMLMAAGCFILFTLFMYFFTNAIRKWKGLAES